MISRSRGGQGSPCAHHGAPPRVSRASEKCFLDEGERQGMTNQDLEQIWENWPEGDSVLHSKRRQGKERVPGKPLIMSSLLTFGFLDSSGERRQHVDTHVVIHQFPSHLKAHENKISLSMWNPGVGEGGMQESLLIREDS